MLLIPVESINLYILWSDGLNLTLKDNLKEHFIKSCKKSDLSRPVIEEIQVTPAIVMYVTVCPFIQKFRHQGKYLMLSV